VCFCENCRGTHGAGDERCPVRQRQVEVARIRAVQKVSCAEAVKRVVQEDWSRVRDPERVPVSRLRSIESDRMCFSKVVFLAVMVVHCTAGM
jgi:hypothetical protein